jgi:hypothetical protein
VQLLKIRYFQLKRDLGIWVFIIALLAFFIADHIAGTSATYSLYLSLAITALFFNYHSQRKDLSFIFKYLKSPQKNVLITYNVLLVPISLAFLLNERWISFLIVHAGVSLASFITLSGTTFLFKKITEKIPPSQFEWIAGIRRSIFILLPLLVVAVILSPVKLFGLIALLLVDSIILSFYNEFEPLVMLNPGNEEPEIFLSRKTGFLNKILIFLNLPLLIINGAFHPEIAWFNAGFIIALLIVSSCSIYLKYSSYSPGGSMSFHIDAILLYASLFFPFLIPITIFILYNTKKKAVLNLRHYL